MKNINSSNVYRVGSALLGLIFLVSGVMKVFAFSGVVGWMTSMGVPLAGAALVAAILIEIVGGATLISGRYARWGAIALAVFIVPTTLIFHGFWSAPEAEFQNQLNHFLKNLSMLGGLIVVAWAELELRNS